MSVSLWSSKKWLRCLVAGTLLLSACKELPDIKPFADATAELKATVSKGEMQAQALLASYADDANTPEHVRATLTAGAAAIAKAWDTTDAGLGALVDYSSALADVAAAGQEGDKAVAKVFSALDGLAAVTPVGGIPLSEEIKAVAGQIGKAVIKAKAAKDLKQATKAANEAVAHAAHIIAFNLQHVRRLTLNVGRAYENNGIATPNAWLIDYHAALLADEKQQAELLTAIVKYVQTDQEACQAARREWRDKHPGVPGPELVSVCDDKAGAPAAFYVGLRTQLRDDALEALRQSDPIFRGKDHAAAARLAVSLRASTLAAGQANHAEMARIDPRYANVMEQQAEVHKTTDATVAVFDASVKAVKAMSKAHDNLTVALAEDSPRFSIREFTSFVQEAADAYKKGSK